MASKETPKEAPATQDLGNQLILLSSSSEQPAGTPQFIITPADASHNPISVLEPTAPFFARGEPRLVYQLPKTGINAGRSGAADISLAIQGDVRVDGPIDLTSNPGEANWPPKNIIIQNVAQHQENIYVPAHVGENQQEEGNIPMVQLPNMVALSPAQKPAQRRAQKKRKFTSYNDDKQWVAARGDKGAPTKPVDVIAAAQALFAKRTRTLYRWLYPNYTKNEVKTGIDRAWAELPAKEREFYFTQVLGRYSAQPRPLMVNPLINRLINKQEDETTSAVNNLLQAEEHLGYQLAVPPPPPAAPAAVEVPPRRGRGRRRATPRPYVQNVDEAQALATLQRLRSEAANETMANLQFPFPMQAAGAPGGTASAPGSNATFTYRN